MLIKLRVRPGSRIDSIERKAPDLYEIHVRAPAERGRANAAALALLGRELGVPAGRIRLVKGGHSPGKIVEIP
jgi:uncharacterized protein YggU (UPF0235/DUF167 family)